MNLKFMSSVGIPRAQTSCNNVEKIVAWGGIFERKTHHRLEGSRLVIDSRAHEKGEWAAVDAQVLNCRRTRLSVYGRDG